jgi:hypothetical protein
VSDSNKTNIGGNKDSIETASTAISWTEGCLFNMEQPAPRSPSRSIFGHFVHKSGSDDTLSRQSISQTR